MSVPAPLRSPVRAVIRRTRLQRGADLAVLFGCAGAVVFAVGLALSRLGAGGGAPLGPWLLAAVGLPTAGLLAGLARRTSPLAAAALLDRAHGLRSRIANAVAFGALEPGVRTPFMSAALEDAAARAAELVPGRAAPFRRPRGTAAFLALLVPVGGLLVAPRRAPPSPLPTPSPAADREALLHADDLDALADESERLLADPELGPRSREAASELNRLIEELAERRLDRAEALRRIGAIERGHLEGAAADADRLRESLRELGRELGGSDVLRPAAEALEAGHAARAAEALDATADRLAKAPPSRAELDRLRAALSRGAEERARADGRLDALRREAERLLRRQGDGGLDEAERRLLDRRRRELERLERARADQGERDRRLERLRREIARAAEDLRRDRPSDAGEALERGAEDLNRAAREQADEETLRQLSEALEAMREELRRQPSPEGSGEGQGGGQGGRMDRFVLRARGGAGRAGGVPLVGPGRPGGGGSPGGAGAAEGAGAEGAGPGGQALSLRPGGAGNATLELPGMGERRPGAPGGGAPGGSTAGVGHDPTLADDPTALRAEHQNVRVAGVEGEGATRSEVIEAAAERGFAGRGYRRVFTDYRDHAEEVLERDEVPRGYRFYLRRYFQLIRPREGQTGDSR